MIQYRIALIFSVLLFITIIFRNSIHDVIKFYYLCQTFPSDDILESLLKLRIRESAQLKTVLEWYDMEVHQKISMPNYLKVEDNGEEEHRSETSITKL